MQKKLFSLTLCILVAGLSLMLTNLSVMAESDTPDTVNKELEKARKRKLYLERYLEKRRRKRMPRAPGKVRTRKNYTQAPESPAVAQWPPRGKHAEGE
jgi:hypothetical protein